MNREKGSFNEGEREGEAKIVHDFLVKFNKAAPGFPLMFKGTLEKAICACWPKNKTELGKILAIYVQKGFGDETKQFVNFLSSRRIKMILMESVIIWGWDAEDPELLAELVTLVNSTLQEAAKEIVSELKNQPFPKLFLLEKPQNVITLARKIFDHGSEDEMFLELDAAISPFVTAMRKMAPLDFSERRKSSLENKETLGDRIEQRASSIAEQHRLRRSQSTRMSLSGVPREPPPHDLGVILVKFTVQDCTLERRFSEEDTVDGVVNYLISQGYSPDAYRFMGRKSRVDIGKVNRELRLKALQVGKTEVIAIEPIKNSNKSHLLLYDGLSNYLITY